MTKSDSTHLFRKPPTGLLWIQPGYFDHHKLTCIPRRVNFYEPSRIKEKGRSFQSYVGEEMEFEGENLGPRQMAHLSRQFSNDVSVVFRISDPRKWNSRWNVSWLATFDAKPRRNPERFVFLLSLFLLPLVGPETSGYSFPHAIACVLRAAFAALRREHSEANRSLGRDH